MPKKAKNLTVISDPLLEPFYVTKDDMCYTVNERITPNEHHFRSKGKGTEYAKPQGYYPEFKQALEKIAKEKLNTKEDYTSLITFLDKFKEIETNIKQYTDGLRSII